MLCNFLCEFFLLKNPLSLFLTPPSPKVRLGGEKCVWVKKILVKNPAALPPTLEKFVSVGKNLCGWKKNLVKNPSSLSPLEKFLSVGKNLCWWKKNLVKNPPSLSPLEKFVSVGKNTPLPALWELWYLRWGVVVFSRWWAWKINWGVYLFSLRREGLQYKLSKNLLIYCQKCK